MRKGPALDDIAFDRLTRQFSAPRTRRETARAVIGTLLGSALLGQDADAVEPGRWGGAGQGEAKSQRRRGGRKRKGKDKRNDACTKVGSAPKRGKPCCKGLVRDDAGHCAAPTAVCVARTCGDLGTTCGSVSDGCGGTLNCGCASGEVCCNGSCLTGVCCVNRQCGPSGNTCTDNECFCGAGPRCKDDVPTCCRLPGECTNTLTDQNNCGECGFPCEGNETCCFGACVDTKSDDVWNCGGCGVQCVIGEICDQGVCKCGVDAGPCREDEFCNGTGCEACTVEKVCAGTCQKCPAPPGTVIGLPNDGFCCPAGLGSQDTFCSCDGDCCEDKCFYEGSPRIPTGEFCCVPPFGYVCPHPDAPDDRNQDICCEDERCNCFNQSGRFGSNRRPGR